MKISKLLAGLTLTLLMLVVAVGSSSLLVAQDGNTGTMSPLTGTWEVAVTEPDGSINPGFVTVNADNTLTETSLKDLTPPVSSPGHGVWSHVKGQDYAMTFKFFIVDPAGNLVCTAKVVQGLTLNVQANNWSGPAHLDCTDPSGNKLFGFDLSVAAARMHQ